MRILRTKADVRRAVAEARAENRTIGLVPTMGAFHAGHESLMTAARERTGFVVVSLFVNPAQFNEASDLAAYPRTEESDAATARARGADVLFAPPVEEIYPAGFSTTVTVEGLGGVLEGAERGPGHFAGVCTVVCKLLNIVAPDIAYFGQKDAQQVTIIRRMVQDLDIPARIEVVPTVREPDGLALSSRNMRLGPADRERALAVRAGLAAVEAGVRAGERDAGALTAAGTEAMRERGVDPEYLALVDPRTLEPKAVLDGPTLVAVAARVGPARLIDNVLIDPAPVATPA